MAPSRTQPASQTPSQAKKQASISSFFTPKPTQPAKPLEAVDDVTDYHGLGDLHTRSSPSREPSNQAKPGTRRLSAHLGKRRSNASLSDVENEEPGSKRQKTDKSEGVKSVHFERTRPNQASKSAAIPEQSPKLESRPESNSQDATNTSRYTFSSSLPVLENEDEDDEQARKYKERMHELFVKKLVRPDAFAELRRRNNPNAVEQDEEDPDADGGDEEEIESTKAAKKKPGGARANGKLTPMEMQYLEIKRQHLDTILCYQVGYKYRIFGEDARTAAKALSFFLIPGKFRYDNDPSEAHWDRLASCSFPVVSLNTHVKRLVAAGHKVGVVRQIETAALKAVGNNRNTPFIRKLTNVYTKGTYVDDVEGADVAAVESNSGIVDTGYLLCLTESNARGYGNDDKVHVGIVAVQPATGSIIYDDFEDGFMRSELETRLLHIAPCEYLVIGELSDATEKLIKHLAGSRSNVFGDQARLERAEKSKTAAAEAYSHISNFYSSKLGKTDDKDASKQSALLDKIHQLTEHVTVGLSAMIKHLTEYGLEHVFDLTRNFQSFSARTHMLINGNTLSSLEIYRNQTDHTEKGSLFWSLDRTKTRFGRRLLRGWVGRPLLDKAALEERTEAVQDLVNEQSNLNAGRLRTTIDGVKSDLEKILTRVYYKKAARPEVLLFLQALQRIANEFSHVKSSEDSGFRSSLLNRLIVALPPVGDIAVEFLDKINAQAAKADDKYNFFQSEHETDEITNHTVCIAAIEHDLDQHRAVAAQRIGKKTVNYVTVLLTEYLIEVPNEKAQLHKVPASWIKVNGTKKMSRFHTPEVVKMIKERDQHKEAMAAACDDAYTAFLEDISARYEELRACIQALATIDCLLSLATVAAQPGYVKPTYVEAPQVHIKAGRHPMVEQLLLDAYQPNDIRLRPPSDVKIDDASVKDPSALLITGPNMGGKSSYVRSVALITIMAQIGSYVPADSAELGMLDAVFTRMGAFDNMMRGESTFMVELGETSDILKQATPRSLVILDELGRGTSTHDGVAIAEAVLKEMVSRGIMTLFITHYQDLAKVGDQLDGLQNVHMKFMEDEVAGEKDITFLYEVGEGVAHRSYGLNVAKLARLPKNVLDVAVVKSRELEQSIEGRKIRNLFGMLNRISSTDAEHALDRLVTGVEQLS